MLSKVILALALGVANGLLQPAHYYEAAFYDYMKKYDLSFENGEEFAKRLEIWSLKDDEIALHNAGNSTYTLGHNAYSYLTWAEFRAHFHLDDPMPPRPKADKVHKIRGSNPASVDHTQGGLVTPVKNQGSCGSCWSFSATGGMEGAYAIANGMNVSAWAGFSEQMLVSCDKTDAGCNGGLMDSAFQWVQGNGGICSETDYPYASGTGQEPACDTSCSLVPNSAPATFTDVGQSEAALEDAVAMQPVSVAIQANQASFQSYTGGVLTARCGSRLDHGVLAVGYGTWTDGVTEYWKVKNSWGDSWGVDGYILLEKGGTAKYGECGIEEAASYPTF